jgi:hypothetical protein
MPRVPGVAHLRVVQKIKAPEYQDPSARSRRQVAQKSSNSLRNMERSMPDAAINMTALSRAGRACKRPRLGAAEGGARGKLAARSVQQRGAAKKSEQIKRA